MDHPDFTVSNFIEGSVGLKGLSTYSELFVVELLRIRCSECFDIGTHARKPVFGVC